MNTRSRMHLITLLRLLLFLNKVVQQKEKEQKKKEKLLITKERTKEHRERITSGESPSPRPIKRVPLK